MKASSSTKLLFRNLGFGGLKSPWRGPDSPKDLFWEIEGELKDGKFLIRNPTTKIDENGKFTLRVKRSFLGDVKECTLAVGISSPSGGIVPQYIPRSGGDLLVFQCPDRTTLELDLGELQVHRNGGLNVTAWESRAKKSLMAIY